jgi:preprotein translocase subunit SecG
MYYLLTIIAIIVAILLVIVVLLQASKGGGLAGISGGSSNIGSMFGTRRTSDFLSKATWWLGGILLGLSIIINLFFLPSAKSKSEKESIIQSSKNAQSVPSVPALPKQTQSNPTGTPAQTK